MTLADWNKAATKSCKNSDASPSTLMLTLSSGRDTEDPGRQSKHRGVHSGDSTGNVARPLSALNSGRHLSCGANCPRETPGETFKITFLTEGVAEGPLEEAKHDGLTGSNQEKAEIPFLSTP